MKVSYKNYIFEIINDSNYTLNSTDNITIYDYEYFEGRINNFRVYANSKHGIRIYQNDELLYSIIICENSGRTTIHNNSFVFIDDSLLICCSNKIYSISIPKLQLNWIKRFDLATCFAIYPFKNDFIIHGELQITRIDKDGNEKWNFGARDIFVTNDGRSSFDIENNNIKLRDWEGYEYLLDEKGKIIKS